FFFFQAEDGIRDGHVTGVQTCALPISGARRSALPDRSRRAPARPGGAGAGGRAAAAGGAPQTSFGRDPPAPRHSAPARRRLRRRSEERRVGKECRSRWEPYHKRKEKRG